MEGVWGTRREAVHMIHFGSYNIRNGRKGGLKSTLQGVSQSNADLGVFQKPNVTNVIYMRESGG